MQTIVSCSPYELIPRSLYQQVRQREMAIVVVGHSDQITLSLLEALSKIQKPILYTDKSYSGDATFRRQIQQLTYGQMISTVEDCLAYIAQNPTLDYLIFDTSGLVSEKVQTLHGNFFIVEDTANGLFWTEQRALHHPIFSIAYSKVKQDVENPAVAQSLFSAIMANTHLTGLSIRNEPILLAGFGSIGSRLAMLLQTVTNRLTVYDNQVQKLLQSSAFGFQAVAQLDETIHQYKWIISTAGDPCTIGTHHLEHLRDGCCLVNCSTRQWEFDATFFAKYQATTTLGEYDLETIAVGNRHIHRLNQGYPVNFWRSGGTQDQLALDTTFAFWLESGLRILLDRQQPQPAIYEVDSFYPELHRKYHQLYADRLNERASIPALSHANHYNGKGNVKIEGTVLA